MSLKEKAREVLNIIDNKGYQNLNEEWVDLSDSLTHTINNTLTYNPESYALLSSELPKSAKQASIEVTDETTQIAASRLVAEGCDDPVLLNFASARNPGGGFLNGAKAQEEDLSRCSILHASLVTQSEYYTKNREQNSMLYTDYAIYSPRVAWFRTKSRNMPDALFHASVITSPAPNANQAFRRGESIENVESTLLRRSKQILQIAREHGHKTILLGAWGCGVFGNDPTMVAKTFKHWLEGEFAGSFDRVVFAVYDRTKNKKVYQSFKDCFTEE